MVRRKLHSKYLAKKKARYVLRASRSLNPTPTFTETFALPRDNLVLFPGTVGVGKAFKISFHDIPQVSQYMTLYTQYRINWVKVMLLPNYNTQSSDFNAGTYNYAQSIASAGQARIAYSIQDSPGEQDPVGEAEVLSDNGCKIKSIGSKWSCSFKPVPDVAQVSPAGNILTRQKFKQWFNYDETTVANNPKHGAVTAWITLPGSPSATGPQPAVSYICYYKVNFTLRDPK